jgi:hypothetical protein
MLQSVFKALDKIRSALRKDLRYTVVAFVMLINLIIVTALFSNERFVNNITAIIFNGLNAPENTERMQLILRQTAAADAQIIDLIERLRQNNPSIARVRVAIIHNGSYTLTGISLLKFDTAYSVTRAGRSVGGTEINLPLVQWRDFLPDFINGQCRYILVSNLQDPAARTRMQEQGADAFVGCPIRTSTGAIIGGIFTVWDVGDPRPTETDLYSIMEQVQQTARDVGLILSSRLHASH